MASKALKIRHPDRIRWPRGKARPDGEEMADAVAFLAGPRSKHISGQLLRVDGGETLVSPLRNG
jgi:NAD(P)-dependent dehydrogenase (short-subunit alcohol dehydrogenase family)